MRNSDVEMLLAKEDWQLERRKLRSMILATGLSEAVKWGKLCYGFEGSNVAIIYGMKAYCAVGFFKGSLLKDEAGLLVSPGKHSQAMRQLRFRNLDGINDNAERISALIEQAIQVEKDGLKVAFDEKDNLDFPDELRDALEGDPELSEAFQKLTLGRQRGYVLHVSQARQPDTRTRRIAKFRSKVIEGKGLNNR